MNETFHAVQRGISSSLSPSLISPPLLFMNLEKKYNLKANEMEETFPNKSFISRLYKITEKSFRGEICTENLKKHVFRKDLNI